MSIEADIALFNAKLDTAIASAMEKDVFAAARDCIIASVFPNVYDKYTPHGKVMHYERRYDDGGLADPENIERVGGGPTPTGYEIEIRNMTEGIDGGGPIDQIIETGMGYEWEGSDIYKKQPYPRPFYDAAEKMMIRDGYFENALMRVLQAEGFRF